MSAQPPTLAFWTGTRPQVVTVSPSIVPCLYSKRTAWAGGLVSRYGRLNSWNSTLRYIDYSVHVYDVDEATTKIQGDKLTAKALFSTLETVGALPFGDVWHVTGDAPTPMISDKSQNATLNYCERSCCRPGF